MPPKNSKKTQSAFFVQTMFNKIAIKFYIINGDTTWVVIHLRLLLD